MRAEERKNHTELEKTLANATKKIEEEDKKIEKDL